jgi:regulator of protease activity HflC (stomatin/prohibitin superfamily)
MQKNKVIFNTTAKRENIMTKLPLKLIVSLSAAFLIIVGSALIWRIETVKGNELAILETFSQGIQQTPLTPRTYIRNSLTENFYHYDLSNKVFVMNNISDSGGETGNGRKDDAYLVQSFDQQDMHISLSVQWRIDPSKIVAMHTSFHAHIGNNQENILEENLIRPNVMRIVKNHATKMTAMNAYSGEGLVKLQGEIEADLASADGELRKNGVIVENFVIEKIDLDPNYVNEIKARQIAQQKKLRSEEETKAADAEALKVKAVAQADLNKAVVEAERDKKVAVLRAEQEAEARTTAAIANKKQTILSAEAESEKLKIASLAEKEAAENRAAALKAEGAARAEAQRLLYSAYSAPGADLYAQIEISKNMASAFGNFNGFLPQNMNFTSLSGDYMSAIRSVLNNPNKITPAVQNPIK